MSYHESIIASVNKFKHSYSSPDRLKRTTDVLNRIRNVLTLFNRIIESLDDKDETLIVLVDFLEPITVILADSISYLHDCSSGKFRFFSYLTLLSS